MGKGFDLSIPFVGRSEDENEHIDHKLHLDYGTGNSGEEKFSFDIEDGQGFYLCADVPREQLVEMANWILDVTKSRTVIQNHYHGPVSIVYPEQESA